MTDDGRESDDWDAISRSAAASPNRLYRDANNRFIMGVCAGIAAYFGINPWAVRLLAIVGLVMFTPPTIVAYFIVALILPKAPRRLYRSPSEERFWTEVRVDPAQSFSELRYRFRGLDHRLRHIETYVTSEAYRINKEIKDLER